MRYHQLQSRLATLKIENEEVRTILKLLHLQDYCCQLPHAKQLDFSRVCYILKKKKSNIFTVDKQDVQRLKGCSPL